MATRQRQTDTIPVVNQRGEPGVVEEYTTFIDVGTLDGPDEEPGLAEYRQNGVACNKQPNGTFINIRSKDVLTPS